MVWPSAHKDRNEALKGCAKCHTCVTFWDPQYLTPRSRGNVSKTRWVTDWGGGRHAENCHLGQVIHPLDTTPTRGVAVAIVVLF